MPLLPFIGNTEKNIDTIVQMASDAGAQYIIPSLGMTMRDRQRDYYYRKLDTHFLGLRTKYEKTFGEQYQCVASNVRQLEQILHQKCDQYRIPLRMKTFPADYQEQLQLF